MGNPLISFMTIGKKESLKNK